MLAETAEAKGLRMLDAPVSGGEAGAHNASLSIMVGGEASDFARARPVLDAVGKTIVHVGPSGSGQTVKAANQLIVGANIQALAEAVVFLEAYGVDSEAALEVLGGGLAGSRVLDQKKSNMLGRTFEPGFRIDLHHKDMGIVTQPRARQGSFFHSVRRSPNSWHPHVSAAARSGSLSTAAWRRAPVRPSDRLDVTNGELRMARMTAAQVAVEILKKEGVTHVFGLPGAAINPFYNAMRTNGGLKHILARHVEGASHMAEGYTRATPGNIGVCIGTSGPAGRT